MNDVVYLYAALTVVLVGLFAYLAYLQRRQSRIQAEVKRLEELVTREKR
ncbi:MAG: CcmD family protein [Candidatus Thermoplasmatota archaeon]